MATAEAHQTPAAAAFHAAINTPFPEISTRLIEVLGQRTIAFAAAVKSMKSVSRWAAGIEPRGEGVEARVRALYRTVVALQTDGGLSDEGVRAWLMSSNPDLEDRAPIEVLRAGDDTPVIRSAEHFRAIYG